MTRWAVFVSGEGTNLQNFIDIESQLNQQSLELVVADRPCRAIERAEIANKKTQIFLKKDWAQPQRVMEVLRRHKISQIFLLGFMKVLSKEFLDLWSKPIINLHPSLLPAHKGLKAIQKAFEAGDSEMGVSLHEVTEDLDSGRILLQKSFIRSNHVSLADVELRIHELEHEIVRDYLFALESSAAV